MTNIEKHSNSLYIELKQLIDTSRQNVAIYVNAEITLLYWNIGKYINQHLITNKSADYGKEILPTLSAKLISEYGKGFSQRNLANMIKFHEIFTDENILQTLSAKLNRYFLKKTFLHSFLLICN